MTTPTDAMSGCASAQAVLDSSLTRMIDALIDPTRPSRLPEWSIGHVLTHLARNADALTGMVNGAAVGEQRLMYPSMEARDGAIRDGATRGLDELVADVRRSSSELEAAWSRLDAEGWSGSGLTRVGPTPVAAFPHMRWREVEVHHADLGLDWFDGANWSTAFVSTDLPKELASRARDDSGFALPIDVAQAEPWRQLAWLYGRPTGLDVTSPRWV